MKYLEEDRPYAETLCFEFSWLINDEYINQVTSSFQSIKDAGLNIISNDSIKGALVSIYEQGFPRLSNEHPFYPDLEEFYEEYYHKNFKPNDDTILVYKEFDGIDTLTFPRKTYFDGEPLFIHLGYVPLDFETLKRDPEFKMLLRKTFKFRRWKIARYERVSNAIPDLMARIEKELKEK